MRLLCGRKFSAAWIAVALLSVGTLPSVSRAGEVTRSARDLVAIRCEAAVTAWFDSLEQQGGLRQAALVIVDASGPVWSRGWGFEDRERQCPVDPQRTVFLAASNGKPITALAALIEVERGTLQLHRGLEQGLRAFRIPTHAGDSLTLAHLLTHTGGFEDRFLGALRLPGERGVELGEFFARGVPERIRPAGELAAYSNMGMALAGTLVESGAGVPFRDRVASTVFTPLGMRHSTFAQPPPDSLLEHLPGGRRAVPPTVLPYPAGSLVATPADMGRFVSALLAHGELGGVRIASPAIIDTMLAVHWRAHAQAPGVAYGWFETRVRGRSFLFHTGDRGHHSLLCLSPEDGWGFYYVGAGGGEDTALREQLLARLVAAVEPEAPPDAPIVVRPTPKADATRIVGLWRDARHAWSTMEKLPALFSQIDVRAREDGVLRARIGLTGPTVALTPFTSGLWRSDDGLWVSAVGPAGAPARSLAISGSLSTGMAAERLAPWEDGRVHLAGLVAGFGAAIARLLALVVNGLLALFRQKQTGEGGRALRRTTAAAAALVLAAPAAVLVFTLAAGMPGTDTHAPWLRVLLAPLALGALAPWALLPALAGAWRRREASALERLALTAFVVASLPLLPLGLYWKLIASGP